MSAQSDTHTKCLTTALAYSALAAILLLARPVLLGLTIKQISLVATVISIACLVTLARRSRQKIYSAGFLYLTVLSLFHLSLAWLVTFRLPFAARYQAYMLLWFREGSWVQEALYLSILAAVAFTAAYWWMHRPRPVHASHRDATALSDIGAVLVIGGAVVFLGYIALAAPMLLFSFGRYRDFDQLVAGSAPIAGGMHLVAIGTVMLAAGPKTMLRRAALAVLLIFTAVVLTMGARTAIMYAGVGAVVAFARMRRMPSVQVGLVFLALAVIAVGVVQQARSTTSEGVSMSPVPALTEMGGSLRPVVETVDWRRGYNEPPRNGITYVAGMLRIAERALGLPRPNPDERFAGTLAAQRVEHYNIGYSAVAEAFLNFGTAGVVVFFVLVGLLLGRWDSAWLSSPFAAALLGVVMYALTYQVRQASNIVLTIIALGSVAVFGVRFVSQVRARPARTPTGRARQ